MANRGQAACGRCAQCMPWPLHAPGVAGDAGVLRTYMHPGAAADGVRSRCPHARSHSDRTTAGASSHRRHQLRRHRERPLSMDRAWDTSHNRAPGMTLPVASQSQALPPCAGPWSIMVVGTKRRCVVSSCRTERRGGRRGAWRSPGTGRESGARGLGRRFSRWFEKESASDGRPAATQRE